jgi:hypothetical protein
MTMRKKELHISSIANNGHEKPSQQTREIGNKNQQNSGNKKQIKGLL